MRKLMIIVGGFTLVSLTGLPTLAAIAVWSRVFRELAAAGFMVP